ncbi:hypothetical protein TOPH_00445 [Tolypocladium ophioglossoides CBS 100239]|uniref:LAA1-like C-terminal TPR repeats domain-containing protein n=1 Tax=Tolypocladium ophioglossoides (strain CBS 100239) TaxID=1163406 RepID=A0A0L0NMN3_TOLOC|nr:hypothetical protein TOPH_00445 [Tolypocladium ophioglossoides CBS 100239]
MADKYLPQTAKIAANCIRSLLLQPSPTAADLSITRYLFPRLLAFVTNVEPEDPERARSLLAHTLCLYVGSLQQDRRSAAMSLVIPTLMTRATGEGAEVYGETSVRLLELAAVDQGTFRAIVGAMSGSQRALLEEVIRSGRQVAGGSDKAKTGESEQPTITLKMDFGG